MSKEAMKLALDFVASISPAFICEVTHHKKNEQHKSNEPCPCVKKQKQTYEVLKEALAKQEQGEPVAWRETYGKVIKALAGIVNVHTPDNLFDLDAIPRDPVMALVQNIKVALDQYKPPKQEQGEPVAVMELHEGGWDLVEDIDTDWLETLPFGTKLYTTPQQPSTIVRKPLTDEQIRECAWGLFPDALENVAIEYFARAIEAAHGIKE